MFARFTHTRAWARARNSSALISPPRKLKTWKLLTAQYSFAKREIPNQPGVVEEWCHDSRTPCASRWRLSPRISRNSPSRSFIGPSISVQPGLKSDGIFICDRNISRSLAKFIDRYPDHPSTGCSRSESIMSMYPTRNLPRGSNQSFALYRVTLPSSNKSSTLTEKCLKDKKYLFNGH